VLEELPLPVPSGTGSGSSSSSSWGGPWSDSYDQTVSYPSFSETRYYGRDYGAGPGEEDDIAYVGDPFSDASGSSSGSGMFPFAYSDEELLFGQAQSTGRPLLIREGEHSHYLPEPDGPTGARWQSPNQEARSTLGNQLAPGIKHKASAHDSLNSGAGGNVGHMVTMANGQRGTRPKGGWSHSWWEGTIGFFAGIGQGAANIVNGVQDAVIGVVNLGPRAVNAIAWAEERVGILNADDPIRLPYIPSPDLSRGLITHEAGEAGSWGHTHGWSKFAGATGVEVALGAWAAKAAKARQLTSAATNYVERNGFRFSEYNYRKL
jgi:hypothetical protein